MKRIQFFTIAAVFLANTFAPPSAMAMRDPLNQNQPGGGYQDGMSLYQYVRSSPVLWIDQNGLSATPSESSGHKEKCCKEREWSPRANFMLVTKLVSAEYATQKYAWIKILVSLVKISCKRKTDCSVEGHITGRKDHVKRSHGNRVPEGLSDEELLKYAGRIFPNLPGWWGHSGMSDNAKCLRSIHSNAGLPVTRPEQEE